MPGVDGGSNTSEDYASHMYIGRCFVGNTAEEVQVGKWLYNVGMTSRKKIVAERWSANDEFCQKSKPKRVPYNKIPKKVIKTISQNAFTEGQAEIASVAKLFGTKPKKQ